MSTQLNVLLPMHTRHYFIDWLRVIAFATLIFYHIGMLYSPNWGFHFKSNYTFELVESFMLMFSPWRMLLIWFISGVALRFMLDKVSGYKLRALFVLKRSIFILLPLLVGLWLIVPLQLYAEMHQQGVIDITYWQFYLAFLDTSNSMFVNYQSGVWPHVDVNHLWYLRSLWQFMLIVFIYSLVAKLSIFSFLLTTVKVNLSFSMLTGLLVIAMLLANNYLKGDAIREVSGFILLFTGYLLAKNTYFWASLNQYRWVLCTSFILLYVCIVLAYLSVLDLPNYVWVTIYNTQRVVGVFAMLTLAQRFLNFKAPYLNTLNSVVFPFYVLHQSALIILCFMLRPFNFGPVVELFLITVGTWGACAAITLVVMRFDALRPFLGIKIKNSYSPKLKKAGYILGMLLILPLAYQLVF
ncbi:acyltransferase family protein [Pseudoalteromonas sp. 10-33]|uniref:acyltransferase family protein n=1 Tax=Pseudoalteromonas sp. 10-33 TaxID=1761890 RepID=UPI000A6E13ED|nr:acyltransferase family protein [Pseudoalteromonas sp. 10-33]